MMLRAIIIDDEPLAVDALRQMCERAGTVQVVGHASDGMSGLDAIAALNPDVVFLDINMPGMNGLEFAQAMQAAERPAPSVVLVTAFDHYATEAFDLCVVDYLLKPVESQRFARAMERVDRLHLARRTAVGPEPPIKDFWIAHLGSVLRVPAASVQRIDGERDYVRLTVDAHSYLIRMGGLSAIAARLDPELFMRVHRSTIVRIDWVDKLKHLGPGSWVVIDRSGRTTRVSRSYLSEVKIRLGVKRTA
jgi:two-component system response regulator AlgR